MMMVLDGKNEDMDEVRRKGILNFGVKFSF